jgi:hypothetical protein
MYCSAAAAGAERCAHSAERGPLASLHAEGRRCRTPKPRVGLPFLPHLLSPNTARTSRALVEGSFALPSEALGGGIRLIATGQRLWTNVGSALRLLVRCRPFFDLVRLRIALLGHWIIGTTSKIPIVAHGWFPFTGPEVSYTAGSNPAIRRMFHARYLATRRARSEMVFVTSHLDGC